MPPGGGPWRTAGRRTPSGGWRAPRATGRSHSAVNSAGAKLELFRDSSSELQENFNQTTVNNYNKIAIKHLKLQQHFKKRTVLIDFLQQY